MSRSLMICSIGFPLKRCGWAGRLCCGGREGQRATAGRSMDFGEQEEVQSIDTLPELQEISFPDFHEHAVQDDVDFSFCNDLASGSFAAPGPPAVSTGSGVWHGGDLHDYEEGPGGEFETAEDEHIQIEGSLAGVLSSNTVQVDPCDWTLTVNHSFERYKAVDTAVKFPWEHPGVTGIFHHGSALSLPRIHGVPCELNQQEDTVLDAACRRNLKRNSVVF